MTDPVFSVQDETGTVYQLAIINTSPQIAVSVGDTGTYTGQPDDGTDGFQIPPDSTNHFAVTQVLSPTAFSVGTTIQSGSNWPRSGTIDWLTGANAGHQTTVTGIDPANAYITVSDFTKYFLSRGISIGTPDPIIVQGAIVAATDYLDQKYRYKGIKLVQRIGTDLQDANAVFLEPWLTPYALNGLAILTPSITPQFTEWPRQGVVDLSGDTVNGIPRQIKMACAELAQRVLNGVKLQPDYDSSVVTAGAVIQTVTEKVGPIERTKTYDTKLGLGFFATFPQIDRMLSRAGLIIGGGGRTVIR